MFKCLMFVFHVSNIYLFICLYISPHDMFVCIGILFKCDMLLTDTKNENTFAGNLTVISPILK